MSRFAQYLPRQLEIIDTTLREGQQTSLLHDHHKYFFTRTDKEEILRALIIYGVKFVELFAPVVSPQERDDFAALKAVRDALGLEADDPFARRQAGVLQGLLDCFGKDYREAMSNACRALE